MTAMVSIDDLLPSVLIYARSAPEPLALKMLRDAARTFCATTRIWRENDTMAVSAPDFEGLCSFAGTEIVAIEDARVVDGPRLTPIAVQDLDAKHDGWRTDTTEATPRYITQFEPNSITIYPRQAVTLSVGLVLQPTDDALTIPQWLVARYGTRIGKAAAGQLLILPATEYANPQLGAGLIAETSRLGGTALRVAKGQQGARIRAKGSFF